ncbi:cytochrome P450 4F8-like [Branchiostoma floridae x Branchiostoma belcheri]
MKTDVDPVHVAVGLLVPVVTYLLYVVAKFVWNYQREFRVGRPFPCPPYHWLYGNLHLTDGRFGERFLSMSREIVEKHPRAHCFWVSVLPPAVMVTHPDTIRQLLKTTTKKSEDYEQLRPWLGNGLITSTGDVWKVHRRLLTPAFHFDILKQYVSVYNRAAEHMIEKLSKYTGKEDSFEMFQQASLCTMEVILQCAFSGGEMSEQTKNEYTEAVKRMGMLQVERNFNPLYILFTPIYHLSPGGREFLRLCDFVHQTAGSIIRRRRQALERDPGILAEKKRLDFIDILLTARDEGGRGLTDLEIREEVDTFLFAGHDTTASTLSWALYSLAQHPHHQDKVRQEVDQLLAGRDQDTIEWEDLHKLPYLTMCLKEAMRLHTPVPLISRTVMADTVIDGNPVPRGQYVGIHLYALHHNPHVWGNQHMEFDPSRFHPDRMKDMDSHAFMPFSAGQRNCIGQNFALNEEKVILARLLHRFTFDLAPGHPVEKDMIFVMKTKDGLWMKVKSTGQKTD